MATTYGWRESSSPSFFPGRHATVTYGAQDCGSFGLVHPEVLKAFDISFPVAALELEVEPFCHDQTLAPLPTHFTFSSGADMRT